MRRLLFVLPLLALCRRPQRGSPYGLTRDPSRIPSALLDRPIPEFALPPLAGYGHPRRWRRRPSRDMSRWSMSLLPGACRAAPSIRSSCVLGKEPGVALYGSQLQRQGGGQRAGSGACTNSAIPIRRWATMPRAGSASIGACMGVPETFVIDRDGRIRHKQVGPITPQDLQQVILPLIARLVPMRRRCLCRGNCCPDMRLAGHMRCCPRKCCRTQHSRHAHRARVGGMIRCQGCAKTRNIDGFECTAGRRSAAAEVQASGWRAATATRRS